MAAQDTKTIVNGINIEQSFAIQNQIRDESNGDLAKPLYQATVVWDSGYHTTTNINGDQTINGDEPVRYGGEGMGATPQDMLLTAVGHCLTVLTLVGYLLPVSMLNLCACMFPGESILAQLLQ